MTTPPCCRCTPAHGDLTDLGRRFVTCFVAAADDAGLPQDPEFRAALRAYMSWAVDEVLVYGPPGSVVRGNLRMPRWSWDGLVGNPSTGADPGSGTP